MCAFTWFSFKVVTDNAATLNVTTKVYWFIDRLRAFQPIDNASGLVVPGPRDLDSPVIFNVVRDVNESFPLTPGSPEWTEAKAAAMSARAAHLATVGWAPNQMSLGNNDSLYAICSDPTSQAKYPQYPNCTITPANWEVPYCSCDGSKRWRLCTTCSPPSPAPAPAPYHPVNSTNCTYDGGAKYNHPIHSSAHVSSKEECCRLCYLSDKCAVSAWHQPIDRDQPSVCFLHSSADGQSHRQKDVIGCVTSRAHSVS